MSENGTGQPNAWVFVDFAQICCMMYFYLQLQGDKATPHLAEHVRKKLNTIKRKIGAQVNNYILVLDEHSVHKRGIYDGYKANRGANRVPVLGTARMLMNEKARERVCVSRGHEADDTIATLCTLNKTGFSMVVSSDKDLWQLMERSVGIFNPLTKKITELTDVESSFGRGVRPRHVPLCKALWGDSGDNVPNVMPRTQKHLIPIVTASDGTIEDFSVRVRAGWDDLSDTVRLSWIENEENVVRNYSVVKLTQTCNILWGHEALA